MTQIDRIVVINDYAKPRGGASFLAALSVKEYRALGYPVTYLTGETPDPDLAALGIETKGVGAKALLESSTLQAFKQGFHNTAAGRLVRDWISENDTPGTVYHLHNWGQMLSPAVFPALRPIEPRAIFTCHDFFNVCPNGGFLHFSRSEPCALKPLSLSCLGSQCDRRTTIHKYWRAARQAHLNRLARFSDNEATFSFIHEKMRSRYLEAGFSARHMTTIPNPVEPWSAKRIEAERNKDFLFVGRISKDKGADIAVEAAHKAGAGIIMIGAGEEKDTLSEKYPAAEFLGWRAREEIIAYARRARALIVPSRVIEPFGLVVLEAAMSGLPVIVADRAFLSHDVVRLGFGLKFDVRDIEDLAQTLRNVLADDEETARMSRSGHENASQVCHTSQSWIAAHLDLFKTKLAAL